MNITESSFFIPIKLTNEALYYANKFADEQATSEKARRIYLNTLAVCAVHSYLQWMEFQTDPTQGDCWHPVVRRFNDIADLVLPNIGKLECRPVLSGETFVSLPPEVREDRIGYVLVQFEEQLDKVKLLGFTPLVESVNPLEVISIAAQKPFDILIEYLQESENAIAQKTVLNSELWVNLSQWLEKIVDEVWQTVQEVLGEQRVQEVFASRSGVTSESIIRATNINLGTKSVALVVAVIPKPDRERDIRLQVHPTTSSTLPPNLKFVVLDTSGKILQEAEAGNESKWLAIPIIGKPGEQFIVKIVLSDTSATRNFTI